MKKYSLTSLTALIICGHVLFGADLNTYKFTYENQMQDIRLEHTANMVKLDRSYEKALDNLNERVTSLGDLIKIKEVMAEIERFKLLKCVQEEHSNESSPDLKRIQLAYIENLKSFETEKAKNIVSLTKKYDAALERLQVDLAKQRKVDEATAVMEERTTVLNNRDVVDSEELLASIKSQKETVPSSAVPDKPVAPEEKASFPGKSRLATKLSGVKSDDVKTGTILREVWQGMDSRVIHDRMMGGEAPDASEYIKNLEMPADRVEHFGERISGYLHPTQDGDYVFWVAADDKARLYLSSCSKPSRKVEISATAWTYAREWDKYPEQKSKPISLKAGNQYYIEVVRMQGLAEGNLSVAWEGPGITRSVIKGKYLSPPAEK